jgi:hypothetical protein
MDQTARKLCEAAAISPGVCETTEILIVVAHGREENS